MMMMTRIEPESKHVFLIENKSYFSVRTNVRNERNVLFVFVLILINYC